MGYSSTQKGYKCYHPPSKKFFVSADVTFSESESYFGSSVNNDQENEHFSNDLLDTKFQEVSKLQSHPSLEVPQQSHSNSSLEVPQALDSTHSPLRYSRRKKEIPIGTSSII